MLPARRPFTAADDATAVIPDMPDVRFWADSTEDFAKALPEKPGPWLTLSSGGSDGAFGAGLLNGLSASGKRPDYAVVIGVSTGALIAPFAFAGPRYDTALRDAFTKITSADVFEIGGTPESFLDTWPLKDLIAKQVTPALIADVAAQYRAGRRLFIVTTNLDSERSMVWNMGAIAAHGGEQAIKLFRTVLLASSSIPGAFPPVFIDVESNGKHFSEMHVDGGVGGQFFVAPAGLMAATSDYRLPATALYVLVDSGLQPDFDRVERTTAQILAQSVGMAVKVDTRLMLDRAYLAAKRSGIGFQRREHTAKLQCAKQRCVRSEIHEGPVRPGTSSARVNPVRNRAAPLSGSTAIIVTESRENRSKQMKTSLRAVFAVAVTAVLATAVAVPSDAATRRAPRVASFDGEWSVAISTSYGNCNSYRAATAYRRRPRLCRRRRFQRIRLRQSERRNQCVGEQWRRFGVWLWPAAWVARRRTLAHAQR